MEIWVGLTDYVRNLMLANHTLILGDALEKFPPNFPLPLPDLDSNGGVRAQSLLPGLGHL